jgi:L-fucose dehydrogenase
MDLKLKNKVIIVTGGAGIRGSIGQTIVYSLAREGAIPVIVCRSERGWAYEKELQEKGIDAAFFQTDLSDIDQVEKTVTEIIKKYGRIDILINNVGVNDGVGLEAPVQDFIKSLELNLISYFAMTKFCLPFLKNSRGNILNIGSKVALTGQGGTSGYAASKGGVLALTREWAVDLLSDGIRSNALIIAECWTPAYQNWLDSLEDGVSKKKMIEQKIPLGNRMTTPEEIANTCMFLISEKSSHTTGEYVFVDGGYVHLDRALAPEKKKN